MRLRVLVLLLAFSWTTYALGVGSADGQVAPVRNGEIVFSSIRVKNGPFDLYRMRADGSRLRRITSGKGFERYPRWSPDGKRIAYVSDRTKPGAATAYEVYVLGTALRRITQDRFIDDQLSWSPNGTKLAFVSNRGGKFGIWVMNANGSGKRLLTADGAVPACPRTGTRSPSSARADGPTRSG